VPVNRSRICRDTMSPVHLQEHLKRWTGITPESHVKTLSV
jgi:hypothetical protein